jgi:RHS repeat-associated protein
MVAAIQINDQAPITFARDPLGRISAERLSEQLSRTYGYDEEGRLVCRRVTSALHSIERGYQYDPTGHLIARNDSDKGNWRYTYDPMGRVIESIDPLHHVRRHTYDPAGDLLKHLPETQKGLRSATHDGATYRFDAAGNLVERTVETQNLASLRAPSMQFQWDANNRLRTVRTPEDTVVRMAYDAIGRRHRKSVNGERTFFAWDGDALLAEWQDGQTAREYVYYPGTFEPLALIDSDGQLYYYHNELNGLPAELTKPNGEPVWSATYDALGRVEKIRVGEVTQPLRMQGQYWDEEIGLCYNRCRYFDPQICSFISQDPIGFAGGENVYAYAPNVWGWVDPLGLACKKATPKPDPNILSGHGGFEVTNSSPITILPQGTSVSVWAEHGNSIYDSLGNSLELKKPITYKEYGNDIVGAKTYLPGSVMPDYTLYPPFDPDLNIMGNPTTVMKPTRLSEILKPGMGNVNWAACLVVEKP